MTIFSQTEGEQTQDQTTENWVQKVVEAKGDQWNDPNTIAKGYVSAQEYISQLEGQIKELNEDLEGKVSTEELLTALQGKQAKPPVEDPLANRDGTNTPPNTNEGVSEENLKSLIEQTITNREQANTANQNIKETEEALVEMFGTEAPKVFDAKAKELGMSKDEMEAIAAKSPTAFFRLIGEQPKRQANPVPPSSVSAPIGNYQSTVKNNAYFQKLRREDKKLYHSPKVQQEMMQQRLAMGEDFYN